MCGSIWGGAIGRSSSWRVVKGRQTRLEMVQTVHRPRPAPAMPPAMPPAPEVGVRMFSSLCGRGPTARNQNKGLSVSVLFTPPLSLVKPATTALPSRRPTNQMTLPQRNSKHRWKKRRANTQQQRGSRNAPLNTEAGGFPTGASAPPSTPIGVFQQDYPFGDFSNIFVSSSMGAGVLQPPGGFHSALPQIPAADNSGSDITHLMEMLFQATDEGGASTSLSGNLSILIDAFSERNTSQPQPLFSKATGNPASHLITTPQKMIHDIQLGSSLDPFPPLKRTSTPLPNITIETLTPSTTVVQGTYSRVEGLHSKNQVENLSQNYIEQYQNPHALEQQKMQLNLTQEEVVEGPSSSTSQLSFASTLFTLPVPSQFNNSYNFLYGLDQMYGSVAPKSYVVEVKGYTHSTPVSLTSTGRSRMTETQQHLKSRNGDNVDKRVQLNLFEKQEEAVRQAHRAHRSSQSSQKPYTEGSTTGKRVSSNGTANSVSLVTGEKLEIAKRQVQEIIAARKARGRDLYPEDVQFQAALEETPSNQQGFNIGDQQTQHLRSQDDASDPSRAPLYPQQNQYYQGSLYNESRITVPPSTGYEPHFPPTSAQSSQGYPGPSSRASSVFRQSQAPASNGQVYEPPVTRATAVFSSHDPLPQMLEEQCTVQPHDSVQQRAVSSTINQESKQKPFDRLEASKEKEVKGILSSFRSHIDDDMMKYTNFDRPSTGFVIDDDELSGGDDDLIMTCLLQPDMLLSDDVVNKLVGMSREANAAADAIIALKAASAARQDHGSGTEVNNILPTQAPGVLLSHPFNEVPELEQPTSTSPPSDGLVTPPHGIKLVHFDPEVTDIELVPKKRSDGLFTDFDFLDQLHEVPELSSLQNVGTFFEGTSDFRLLMDHVPDVNGFESSGVSPNPDGMMEDNGDTNADDPFDFMKKNYYELWDTIRDSPQGSMDRGQVNNPGGTASTQPNGDMGI